MSPRAQAMSAEDRRASIVAATRPLIREHGADLTTKQIAAAAGVAEGTLFRVFDNKEAILRAVVMDVMDPDPILAEIDALDSDAPLADFFAELVTTMKARVQEIFDVVVAIRWMPDWAIKPRTELDPIQQRVVDLLEKRRAELSVEPMKAAEVLRLLIFAGTHPMINEGRPLATADIVAVLLDGVRRHDSGFPTKIRAVAAHTVPAEIEAVAAAPSAKSRRRRSPSANTS